MQDSELCLRTVVTVFRNDVTAHYSAVLLRLIARMIKERRYKVHPNVLSCLLALRLRSELSSPHERKARPASYKERKQEEVKVKSEIRKKWMNKNRRKAEKEKQEVEKELQEASAEVDTEERSKVVSSRRAGQTSPFAPRTDIRVHNDSKRKRSRTSSCCTFRSSNNPSDRHYCLQRWRESPNSLIWSISSSSGTC